MIALAWVANAAVFGLELIAFGGIGLGVWRLVDLPGWRWVAALVAVAEDARGRYASLADRAARLYSPLVHLLSFTAFAAWMMRTGGDVRFALNVSAAVLIITCPCALGLAVPAVVTAASGRLFRMGLLVKSGTALERLAHLRAHGESEHAFGWAHLKEAWLWRERNCNPVAAE